MLEDLTVCTSKMGKVEKRRTDREREVTQQVSSHTVQCLIWCILVSQKPLLVMC